MPQAMAVLSLLPGWCAQVCHPEQRGHLEGLQLLFGWPQSRPSSTLQLAPDHQSQRKEAALRTGCVTGV